MIETAENACHADNGEIANGKIGDTEDVENFRKEETEVSSNKERWSEVATIASTTDGDGCGDGFDENENAYESEHQCLVGFKVVKDAIV